MRRLDVVEGLVIPLDRADVDTDQIIPARHLKRLDRAGLGQFCFEAWRGPGFVLEDPRLERAPILLAGPNFGCGSSREHAPWALDDLGIRVIAAPSFADIFRANCARVGILPAQLPAADVAALMRRALAPERLWLRVDLRRLAVEDATGGRWSFELDPFVQRCLLEGLDAIALTLARESDITAHERARPGFLPSLRRPA
jgi:3-isopropylmalate/(R)-2-methylmalate dehydratase small subunit